MTSETANAQASKKKEQPAVFPHVEPYCEKNNAIPHRLRGVFKSRSRTRISQRTFPNLREYFRKLVESHPLRRCSQHSLMRPRRSHSEMSSAEVCSCPSAFAVVRDFRGEFFCKPQMFLKTNVDAKITEAGSIYSRTVPCGDDEVPTVTIAGESGRNLEGYSIGCAEEMIRAEKLVITNIDQNFNINMGFQCFEIDNFKTIVINNVCGHGVGEVIDNMLTKWNSVSKQIENLQVSRCEGLPERFQDTIRAIVDEGNWRHIDVVSCGVQFSLDFVEQIVDWWEQESCKEAPVNRELRFTVQTLKGFGSRCLLTCTPGRTDQFYVQKRSRKMTFDVEESTRTVVITCQ